MAKLKNDSYLGMNIENNIQYWRGRISHSIFLFLTIFGFLAYIPSVILSIRDDIPVIALLDTVVYGLVIFITLNKRISEIFKSAIGSILFYILGMVLLFTLGPYAAGNLWLFAFSLIAGLTLGEKAGIISLIINITTQVTFYILIQKGMIFQEIRFHIEANMWLIRAVNFIVLNIIIVISNSIFVKGFRKLLTQSYETKKATIVGLAKLAEHRDSDTGEHLNRIQYYTTIICREMAKKNDFHDYITEEYINDMAMSSILHDIGKVGIQDAILLKPGKLNPEEFNEIKQHPIIGGEVIEEIEKNIKGRSLYMLGREIAFYHHEKWDGTGYPEGLSCTNIPLSARIVALVDVYDALTSERPYKEAFSHDKARKIILDGKGSHFDPQIVDIFLKIEVLFKNFSERNCLKPIMK